MADVAMLDLVECDAIDFENEAVAGGGQSYAPPPEGRYVGKVGLLTDEVFGATKEGYLKVSFPEIEIVGPVGAGYKIKYQMPLSAKKYSNREGNSILDFLRAVGMPVRPKSNSEYIAAVKQASGRQFSFGLVWEAYDKDTGVSVKGEDQFPVDPQDPTKHLPYIIDADDPKKRIFANGKVKYYISAIAKS